MTKVICRKPACNREGKGVAKFAEYYISGDLPLVAAYTEDSKSWKYFVGFYPYENFITLAEFRNIRIENIFKD